jgi:multisubunit Na+/H+ antiporter MnhF subunit
MVNGDYGETEISHHIFPTSATMIGVCLTVITLFRIMKLGMTTLADEILGIDTLFFIISCFFAYLALTRKGKNIKKIELIADISFFIGTVVLAFICIMIVFLGV